MSGFKETFTKEEGGEKNLDYDDSAFLYFAGVLELLTLCPLLYVFIKKKLLKIDSNKKFTGIDMNSLHCPCSLCQSKLHSRKILHNESKFGFSGVLQLLLILFIAILLYLTIEAILNSPTDIKKFDPYEILGVEIGSTEKRIRSAFRELSKIYHPDKNIGNNWAAGKYVQITKAYETLTNELARTNYEKYGNPDGPTPVKVTFT